MKKFYWCHSESESIGVCDPKEELYNAMEQPLVDEIDEDEFMAMKERGWSE